MVRPAGALHPFGYHSGPDGKRASLPEASGGYDDVPPRGQISNERQEIAAIARRRELLIIEDDVFGCLPEERPPPLAYFAPERTLFVTSVSKSLAPGLRVGFLYAPSQVLRALRAAVNLSCWMPRVPYSWRLW